MIPIGDHPRVEERDWVLGTIGSYHYELYRQGRWRWWRRWAWALYRIDPTGYHAVDCGQTNDRADAYERAQFAAIGDGLRRLDGMEEP